MKTRFKLVPCLPAGLLLAGYAAGAQPAQQPAPATSPRPPAQRTVVLLDPAHGGTDPGADLGDKVAEKAVTLALASKLRTVLGAQGFTVVLTRDSDSGVLTADQRAETANRSHAMACVSLHATRSGAGAHIYTSALQPGSGSTDAAYVPKRWETAQEDFIPQSTRLAADLKAALSNAGLPTDIRAATVPPIDSLMCPAVAVEFAPMDSVAAGGKGAADGSYQDTAVQAIAAALGKWRTENAPQPPVTEPETKATP